MMSETMTTLPNVINDAITKRNDLGIRLIKSGAGQIKISAADHAQLHADFEAANEVVKRLRVEASGTEKARR